MESHCLEMEMHQEFCAPPPLFTDQELIPAPLPAWGSMFLSQDMFLCTTTLLPLCSNHGAHPGVEQLDCASLDPWQGPLPPGLGLCWNIIMNQGASRTMKGVKSPHRGGISGDRKAVTQDCSYANPLSGVVLRTKWKP